MSKSILDGRYQTIFAGKKTIMSGITGKIKNQVDAIWMSFWTGGITNSIDVLEQMTYLFFMKMLDDAQLSQEAKAAMMGMGDVELPDAVFKKGIWHNPDTQKDVPYKNLRWSEFRNFTPEQMFDTVRFDVFNFIKHLSDAKTSAYSRFMSDAVFLIQQPRTLVKVVEGINSLDMNDRDTMGDVYEYVLGKMAASGTNGQFRSPRHIIRMMVELMEPKLTDRICDPAMGTAGFLVESTKYVKEAYQQELLKKQNAQHYRKGMFSGFDTDPKMLRIGSMNLMLNGVDDPDVRAQDSLSNQNTTEGYYTLIMANPPFSGTLDYEVVNDTLLAKTRTKKTELLFMTLFIRMLELGGRCASIVPDGVLFGTSTAHLALRKELVDNQREKFHFILGNLVNDPKVQEEVGEQCYDIVAANILLIEAMARQSAPARIRVSSCLHRRSATTTTRWPSTNIKR